MTNNQYGGLEEKVGKEAFDKVVLHIGASNTTLPRRFEQSTLYILVDPAYKINGNDSKIVQDNSNLKEFFSYNIDVDCLNKLPNVMVIGEYLDEVEISPGSVDEAYVFNVFNDPNTMRDTLGPLVSLLKRRGIAYVGADNTPEEFDPVTLCERAHEKGLSSEIMFWARGRKPTEDEVRLFYTYGRVCVESVGTYLVRLTKI